MYDLVEMVMLKSRTPTDYLIDFRALAVIPVGVLEKELEPVD